MSASRRPVALSSTISDFAAPLGRVCATVTQNSDARPGIGVIVGGCGMSVPLTASTGGLALV
jgi:hypothetical protein